MNLSKLVGVLCSGTNLFFLFFALIGNLGVENRFFATVTGTPSVGIPYEIIKNSDAVRVASIATLLLVLNLIALKGDFDLFKESHWNKFTVSCNIAMSVFAVVAFSVILLELTDLAQGDFLRTLNKQPFISLPLFKGAVAQNGAICLLFSAGVVAFFQDISHLLGKSGSGEGGHSEDHH